MNALARYTRNAKTILLAGTMLLMTITVAAQQEIDPEHFDGSQSTVSQKAPTAKSRKQVASAHKTNTASKPRRSTVAANKNSEQPKVVTVAAR